MVDPAATRLRRVWRIILVLSLALNIAIVGMVAGFVLRNGKAGPPRGFDLSLGPIGQALDRKDRRAISNALRRHPELRPQRRGQVFAGMDALINAVEAQPFDPDAVRAALQIPLARLQAVQNVAQDALIEQIEEMSDAQRAAFAERLRSAPRTRR